MPNQFVKLTRSDDIATLVIDRPPVNAIDLEVVHQTAACFTDLERQEPRALVLTGAGTCFCAGLDLKAIPEYGAEDQRRMIEVTNRMISALYGLGCPAVAAVNGHAIAGGLVLALACDYRVASDAVECQLGLTEARAGIPFPAAAMAVVRGELAPQVARRLTLEARNHDPRTALSWGIVDEIQPADRVLTRAREVAEDLASAPRPAYAAIKQQLRGEALAHLRSTTDPFLESWLTPQTKAAAAKLLRR